jgi:hypothetical protein
MHEEDHPAHLPNNETNIFDLDKIFLKLLLDPLASATSTTPGQLCQPFMRSGSIVQTVAVSGTFPFPAWLVRHSQGRHIHHD